MNMWIEDQKETDFRVCVREVKTFDGKHENVKVVSDCFFAECDHKICWTSMRLSAELYLSKTDLWWSQNHNQKLFVVKFYQSDELICLQLLSEFPLLLISLQCCYVQ